MPEAGKMHTSVQAGLPCAPSPDVAVTAGAQERMYSKLPATAAILLVLNSVDSA